MGNGQVFQKNGGTPSGSLITSNDNIQVNAMADAYAYKRVCGESASVNEYLTRKKLKTLGDDKLNGNHPHLASRLSSEKVIEALAELGLQYELNTPATMSLAGHTFLGWKFTERKGEFWFDPEKILCTLLRPSDGSPKSEYLPERIVGLAPLSLYSGKLENGMEVFDVLRDMYNGLLREGINPPEGLFFPSRRQVVDLFRGYEARSKLQSIESLAKFELSVLYGADQDHYNH